MPNRRWLSSPLVWTGASLLAIAIGIGCSSTSTPSGPASGCDGGACADAGAAADTGTAADAGADAEAADASHDGPPPDALYGACAIKGSFGSPCTLAASGADPAECTDPNFPQCFVGGQGAWCSKLCASLTDCTTGASDAGCVPTGCNGRGFCK